VKVKANRDRKKGGSSSFRLLIFFSILLLLFCSCSKKNKAKGHILSTVNGQEITIEQFKVELKRAQTPYSGKFPNDPISSLQIKTAFLSQLIERALVEQEAAKRGIKIEEEELKQALSQIRTDYPDQTSFENSLLEKGLTMQIVADQIRHGIIVDKLVSLVIIPKIAVSDDEIKRFYESHPERYTAPEGIRLSQIVTRNEEQALKALSELTDGANFAEEAKKYSIAPEAVRGGDLGWMGIGQLPTELEQVAFTLAEGGTSGIIRTEFGYHILRLTGRRTVGKTPFETVKDSIKDEIREIKMDQAWSEFVQGLKAAANISINQAALATIP